MAITIIVEDGSNIPNANSYISIADARTYATNRGVALPENDDDVAAMLIKAVDYLETFGCKYQGVQTYDDQSLLWPRKGVVFNDKSFPDNKIPKQLISVQNMLVLAVHSGVDLMPIITPDDYIIKEQVGPLVTEWADKTKISLTPWFSNIESAMNELFGECGCGGGGGLRTIRI